jgi:hypothetical protein
MSIVSRPRVSVTVTALITPVLLLFVGCRTASQPTDDTRPGIFMPVRLRLHPVFTQLQDWTDDGKIDGVETLIELTDRFGDTTKAAGVVRFELFNYRPFDPDPRGDRLFPPFEGRLLTFEQQQAHWSRPSRAYLFQLAAPSLDPSRAYVLSATFDQTGGGRFFDQIVIEPVRRSATTWPAESQTDRSPASTNPDVPVRQPAQP